MARRPVEAGGRLVTVTWPIGKEFTHFDTHADNYPTMDQGIAALLHDLKDRGRLNDTLVVCTGGV